MRELIIASALLVTGPLETGGDASAVTTYRGMADASAAVALGEGLFLAAEDQDNFLGIYSADRPGLPLQRFDWTAALGISADDRRPETDIEGATTLNGRIWLTTSHGRNRNGRWRPNRHRFFAVTAVRDDDGRFHLRPYGRWFGGLARALAADPRYRTLGLDDALGQIGEDQRHLAPKRRGLNIEALAAAPDGEAILIGFRNPQPEGQALIAPLLNPERVVLASIRPRFGDPILLDLAVTEGGRRVPLGIRGMEYSPHHGAYLLIAGPVAGGGPFAAYRWSGEPTDRPEKLSDATAALGRPVDFKPETVIVHPDGRIAVLSDDGSMRIEVDSPAECAPGRYEDGACEAKYLLDMDRRTFRHMWLPAPTAPGEPSEGGQ